MIQQATLDDNEGYLALSGTQGVFGYRRTGTYYNKRTEKNQPYDKIVLEEVYEIKGGKDPGLKKRSDKKWNASISVPATLAKDFAELLLVLADLKSGGSDDEVGDMLDKVGLI